MPETQSIQARLRDASTLPDTLAVSFDAFEAIRLAARSCVDRDPGTVRGVHDHCRCGRGRP